MVNVEGKTKSQLETIVETITHIETVRRFLTLCIRELEERAIVHDASKNESPELEVFTDMTPKLKGSTYGSDEYNGFLQEMNVALEHHYGTYRHHPEHFPDGINDMNLIDIIEMVCDWKASTLRHNDGNILKSIEHNKERFNIDSQLAQILKNTVELFEGNK